MTNFNLNLESPASNGGQYNGYPYPPKDEMGPDGDLELPGLLPSEGEALVPVRPEDVIKSAPTKPDYSNPSRRGFLLKALGIGVATLAAGPISKETLAATSYTEKEREKMEVGTQGMMQYDQEAAKNKAPLEKGVIKSREEAERLFVKGEYKYYYPESALDPKKKSPFEKERESLAKQNPNKFKKELIEVAKKDSGTGEAIMKEMYLTEEEKASLKIVTGHGLIVFAEVAGGKGYAVLPPNTVLITQSDGEYKGSQVILACMNPIIARAKGNCPPPCITQD